MILINKRQVKLHHKIVKQMIMIKANILKLKDQILTSILILMIKSKGRNKLTNNWWISLRTDQIHQTIRLLGRKVNYLRK